MKNEPHVELDTRMWFVWWGDNKINDSQPCMNWGEMQYWDVGGISIEGGNTTNSRINNKQQDSRVKVLYIYSRDTGSTK